MSWTQDTRQLSGGTGDVDEQTYGVRSCS